MRRRIILLAIVGGLVLVVGAGAAWLWAQPRRDPLPVLRRDPSGVRVTHDSAYGAITASGEARSFRDVTIETLGAGTIRFTVSRPMQPGTESLPLVVILAGLRTGRASLELVDRHGPAVLVGYQYPYSQETWYQSARVTQLLAIRSAALAVPWQVTHIVERLEEDGGVDTTRTALLGYSFGAMFVPATQRLAAADGRPFDAAIMAFGGADIEALLDANLRVDQDRVRHALAWTGAALLHPLEPALHLPELPGRFLVIRGSADRQIPDSLSARMADLTPEPKEVVTLDSGHMNPRDPALTQRVIRLSQDWLTRTGILGK